MWDRPRDARWSASARADGAQSEEEILDVELLAEFLGGELLCDPEHPAWRDDRFLAWLAVEARARAERRLRISEPAIVSRGEELMARAQARRLRIVRRQQVPEFDPERFGPPREVLPARLSREPAALLDDRVAAGVGRDLLEMEPTGWIRIPDELPDGRYLAIRIAGDSMEPVMRHGDTILVRVETDIKCDTVVVARHPEDGYVCKRVQRILKERIELSSLAPDRPLVVIPRDPRLIVGTVVYVWCGDRPGPAL